MSEPTKIKHNDDESPYCVYPDACVNQLTREFEAYVEHNLGGTLKFRTFAYAYNLSVRYADLSYYNRKGMNV